LRGKVFKNAEKLIMWFKMHYRELPSQAKPTKSHTAPSEMRNENIERVDKRNESTRDKFSAQNVPWDKQWPQENQSNQVENQDFTEQENQFSRDRNSRPRGGAEGAGSSRRRERRSTTMIDTEAQHSRSNRSTDTSQWA